MNSPTAAGPHAPEHDGQTATTTPLSGLILRIEDGISALRNLWRRRKKTTETEVPAATAHEEAAPPRPPLSLPIGQTILVVVVALILGAIGGLWNGYSRFAKIIDNQSTEINTKQTRLKTLEKEVTSIKQEAIDQQKQLADMQKSLDDSQHELAQATTTVRTQKEALDRMPAPPDHTASSHLVYGRRDSTAPLGGQCDISAANPSEGLAQCIEVFNRLDRRDRQ